MFSLLSVCRYLLKHSVLVEVIRLCSKHRYLLSLLASPPTVTVYRLAVLGLSAGDLCLATSGMLAALCVVGLVDILTLTHR